MSTVEPSLAGFCRPQDKIQVCGTRDAILNMREVLAIFVESSPNHGAVAIAAITSCTNTSYPPFAIFRRLARLESDGAWHSTCGMGQDLTGARLAYRGAISPPRGLPADLEALGLGVVRMSPAPCEDRL
ncbi:aconitase family protein [Agrobacterium pusense]|uniref:aconitase family protein n=1 Tax=Agrobacterium pusense TaxID=648995 RepID=UPI0035E3F387